MSKTETKRKRSTDTKTQERKRSTKECKGKIIIAEIKHKT